MRDRANQIETKKMKKLLTIFTLSLFAQLTFGQNCENERLIKERERFVFKVDSLIKCCRDSLNVGHAHGVDKETGATRIVHFISPNEIINRIKAISEIADKDERERLFEELHETEESWRVTILEFEGKYHYSYFQYGKLVATKKTSNKEYSEIGEITVYDHSGQIVLKSK
jgi:hypothetical protein